MLESIEKIINISAVVINVLTILMLIIIPTTNNNYLLFIHTIIMPFIFFHWLLQDNTCMLTVIERRIRKILGVKNKETYIGKFIEPIYDLPKILDSIKGYVFMMGSILWIFSMITLILKYKKGKITSIKNLFEIK